MKKRFAVIFLIFVLAAGISLQGCTGRKLPPSSQIAETEPSGTYLYGESITSDPLYAGSEEAPAFIFTAADLALFWRDLAHYSPRSSLGRYYGSRSAYPKTESRAVHNPIKLLAHAGVDTSSIQSCRGYVLAENQLAYFLVDGQVWVMQYQDQRPFVFSVVKAGQLELQAIDPHTAGEEKETIVLVDTAAPQTLDIEGASVTKQNVLQAMGVSDREAGILVAYEDGYRVCTTEHCTKYIVFEFEGDMLRSRAEYRFYGSGNSSYAAAKAAVPAGGACNDTLHLIKTTYAYDVDLPEEYRGLHYEQLEEALQEAHVTIVRAVTPHYKSLPSFSFSDVSQLEFWFASGAGAPVEELPEGYRSWMFTYGDYIGTELPFYGLYNVNGEQGYSSHSSST